MFNKIFEKLEKMSTRKLLTIAITTGIATLISIIMYANPQQDFWIVFIVVVFACPFAFCFVQLITNKQKKKHEKLLNEIKEFLSTEEYREVEFLPDIFVSRENENLKRCTEIINSLHVKHFAKVDGEAVIIIAKDKSGNIVGWSNTYTPKFFKNNYKIK